MARLIRALTALSVLAMAACGNSDAAPGTTAPAASTRVETTVPTTAAANAADLQRLAETTAALDALTSEFRVAVPAVKVPQRALRRHGRTERSRYGGARADHRQLRAPVRRAASRHER